MGELIKNSNGTYTIKGGFNLKKDRDMLKGLIPLKEKIKTKKTKKKKK